MKSKLTDEFIEDFCGALGLGLSIKSACDYCNISEVCYYNYVKKAEEDMDNGVKNSKYVKLFKRVQKAKASFRVFHMKKIRDAAESGSWQASAWTLERCCPDEFGRSMKNDMNNNGVIPELLSAFLDMKKEEQNEDR